MRIKKVKPVLQMTSTECGLCCVAMICEYYGKIKPLTYYRSFLQCGRDGSKVKDVVHALENLGINCEVKLLNETECLQQKNPYMVIVDNKHFVVVQTCNHGSVRVYDPAIGEVTLSYEEFKERAGKYIITTRTSGGFVKEKEIIGDWKEFVKIFLTEKSLLVFMLLIDFALYLAIIIMPIIVQRYIDAILEQGTILLTNKLLVISFIGIFSYLLLGGCKILTTVTVEKKIDKKFNYTVMKKLLNLPYHFFEVRSGGDLLYRLNLMNSAKNLIALITGFILNCVGIIVTLIYSYMLSVKMSIVASCVIVFIMLLVAIINDKIVKSNYYEVSEMMEMNSVQSEMINSMFEIKALHFEKLFFDKFNKQYTKYLNRFANRNVWSKLYEVLIQFLQVFVPFFLLLFNLVYIDKIGQSVGGVIGFYSVSAMLINSLISIIEEYSQIKMYKNSIARINEILVEKELEYGNRKIDQFERLDVKNIKFSYTNNSELVIKDVSIKVKKRQKIAIVGVSGSGKSTIVKMLLGLYRPNTGKVLYNGRELYEYEPEEFGKKIGVVTQEAVFFHDSIKENVVMKRENVSREELYKAFEEVGMLEDILSMPMKEYTLVSDFGRNLSGGQKQRLAMARSLIGHPELIILDEATSSLDGITEQELVEFLEKFSCAQIIISHRLSTIKNADYIYVLKDGTVIEEGSYNQLLDAKLYFYDLFKSQFVKG